MLHFLFLFHFQDFFFYSLVYDPQQKTLLADKGEIRVGNRYQADITDLLKEGNFHNLSCQEAMWNAATFMYAAHVGDRGSYHHVMCAPLARIVRD